MHDNPNKIIHDHIAYNLRRAAEERGKAADARSERDYRARIEIAEIFEARADAALTPLLTQAELELTLH